MRTAIVLLVSLLGCDSGASPIDARPDAAPPDANVEEHPYVFLTVERWSRAGVLNTMAAVVFFHPERGAPLFRWVDDHCAYHEGVWDGTAWPSFGDLTLTGTSEGAVDISGDGYETPPILRPGWDVGDLLTVTATGDTLPGFVLSGTVPPAPTLTSHDLSVPGPGQIVLHRDQSFPIAWAPVDGEVFALILSLDDDLVPARGVQCFFPGNDGAGTIPAAALAHLMQSSEVHHTNFYFSAVARDRVPLDGVDVDLAVWNGSATRIDVGP